jgi:hypothetical protein
MTASLLGKIARYTKIMAKEIVVDKNKFDTLLRKMLDTPPLPKADVQVRKPKKKKRKQAA